jgi:hypothetical protein
LEVKILKKPFCDSHKIEGLFMKHTKTLGLAISLLLGSQASYALQPWVNSDITPDYIIYTSGGAAQDKAYGKVVSTALAKTGTLDVFNDLNPKDSSEGKRWTAYYFIGADNLSGGLAGKKILLEKRIYGAAGYGVVPVVANLPIEHLNIFASKQQADWTLNTKTNEYSTSIGSGATATKFLKKVTSDGGFLGVDPNVLLKPKTENYPVPVNELITGKPDAKWSTTLTSVPTTGANAFTVVPTGGLVYGVGVTLDLYKVLQVAQKRAGILSSDVTLNGYAEKDLPKLNRNVVASILAGKIQNWEQFKIIDKTDGKSKSLLDPSILSEAGVSAPTSETVAGIPTPVTPVAGVNYYLPPEVFGLGVITLVPSFAKSSQSLIFLGLPLRTKNTIVDV